MVKPTLGDRLVLTGALMVVMALALWVAERLQQLGPGGRFSLGIGVAGVVVAAVGLLLTGRRD